MATETRTGITWPAVSPVNLKFRYFRRAQDIQHVATGACMQPPQIVQTAKIGEGWGRLVINRIAHSASPAGAFQELQTPSSERLQISKTEKHETAPKLQLQNISREGQVLSSLPLRPYIVNFLFGGLWKTKIDVYVEICHNDDLRLQGLGLR